METTTYRVTLASMPASQFMAGCPVTDAKGPNETHEQFEERTWKQKIRTNKAGEVVLNQFAVKNALEGSAKRLKRKIPGERNSTFTKLFMQGVMIGSMPVLKSTKGKPYKPDDFTGQRLFVPSDGKRGGGKRVTRIFPTIDSWSCEMEVIVIDPKITEDVLKEHLTEAGVFIGLGSMRAENGGVNGRFIVQEVTKV